MIYTIRLFYSGLCVIRILPVFLFGCLLLSSCKKERTIHITAKNAVTGQPYPGLTYYVVQEMTAGDGEKTKTVATGTLDANGEAHLTKKLPKAHSYSVRVEAPANTCYNKQITYYFANQETTFECPFEFAECAYLKLNINNVNCQGATDYFKLYHYGSDVGFENISQGNPIRQGAGCYFYIGSDFSSVPIGRRFYKWEVTRNSITNTYYDTIYLSPGEYKTYDINY